MKRIAIMGLGLMVACGDSSESGNSKNSAVNNDEDVSISGETAQDMMGAAQSAIAQS